MTKSTKSPADDSVEAATSTDRVARSLPKWDLLPGHSMLTRRRPTFPRAKPPTAGTMPPAAVAPASPSTPQPASPPAAAPLEAAYAVTPAEPVAASAAAACRACDAPLEPDARFCAECGTEK